MKKLFLIGIGFILAVAIFGVVGFAYAQVLRPGSVQALRPGSLQTQDPPEPQPTETSELPYGREGWSRGTRGNRRGEMMNVISGPMMGFGLDEDQPGLLHDYLWPAVAEAFGLRDGQVEAFELVRETMKDIRTDLSQEEIQNTMKQARTIAIENALTDGAITEEQAAAWLDRIDQMGRVISPDMGFNGRRTGAFRDGFSTGVKFGRQMMLNHEYMEAAIADALDISVDDLQQMRSEEGFNWKTYVDGLGLSDEESAALLHDIFTNAVNAALEDGAITQAQADWMLDRLDNSTGRGVWFDQP